MSPAIKEYFPSELNVFQHQMKQIAIEDTFMQEIFPTNSLESSDIIEFYIPPTTSFRNLSKMFLEVEIQVVKNDNSKFKGEAADASVANNILFSLFRSCYVKINNFDVVSIDSNFSLKDFLETNLNYSSSTAQRRLITQGFIVGGKQEELKKLIEKSRRLRLYGKLNVLNLDSHLVPGASIYVKLNRQMTDYVIIEDSTKVPNLSKVIIHEARLHIENLKCSTEVLENLTSYITNHNAIYHFKKALILTQNVIAGTSVINLLNFYSGPKPRLALALFSTHAAFSGTASMDPYIFKDFTCQTFSYLLNGVNYPQSSLQINDNSESNNSTAKVFYNLCKTLQMDTGDRQCLVSKQLFDESFFCFGVDFTNANMALTNISEVASHCSLGITATLRKPLSESITVVLYLLVDSSFEIDKSGQVKITS